MTMTRIQDGAVPISTIIADIADKLLFFTLNLNESVLYICHQKMTLFGKLYPNV